ncbi:hypothetical protein BASA50_007312 [Batrachochytrium salamandrivorans]|uniref:Nucleoporin Nup54 alpha-helical domain-containing protein n=1 Tax=Batrachochytrium salamandrivorans TaxID=1357716 RepID=A0ABQ8F8N4_9FUNG|nr:hypothetical protein BASA50_007312 [Batrachochytrium salamandrivorans]
MFGSGGAPAFGAAPATNFGFGAAPGQQQSSLFGAPTSQPQTSGFLGATANAGGGLAAQAKPPAFGGFGTAAPASTMGASLFGSAAPASTMGASLFGSAAPASTMGTSLFGSAAPASTMGTSLFGSAAPPTSQFGAPPATGLSGSLFGNASTASAPGGMGAGSLFGQAKPALTGFGAAPAATGGLFGQAKPAAPAFGMSAGVFGQQPAAAASGLFGQPQPQQQVQQQQNQIVEAIQAMEAYWNPQSPQCNFKFYFYNMVHQSEAHLYQPPPHEIGTYQQAQLNNPDPTCMVPVLAVGFGDLKKRMEVQERQQAVHKEKLEMIASRVDALKTKHFVDTLIKLDEYKRRQRQMVHKTYMLMKTVQILRNRGYSIRADEEALRSRLEAMERDLQKPSIFRGRLNEIWAQLQQLKDSKRMSEDATFSVVNEEALTPVLEALSEMQNGLGQFTKLIQSDQRNLEVMTQAYSETPYLR